MTAEQEARDLLERMEIPNAQSFSSGELVELANLISVVNFYRKAKIDEIAQERLRGYIENECASN
jgi:hypothetical protein